ncbi:MAG TPA: prolyl oligopeptidase family serine peptidase [Vicinamibacterales bacterium]|nr:prolyl oligopeptidase family serine peptidase [Vicinamibacterales bacterium]
MNHQALRAGVSRRLTPLALALIAVLGLAYALPSAQAPAKKALTVEDYTRWRSISGQEISGDGKWVTYGLAFTNTAPAESKPVLHVLNLETNQDVAVPNATGGTFSSDSRWIAYQVDPSGGGRGGRGGRGGAAPAGEAPASTGGAQTPGTQPAGGRGAGAQPTPPRHVELRNLSTGTVQSWQDIQSFTFSPTASHLLLRRRPPTPAGGAGRAGGDAAPAPGSETPGGGGAGGNATPTGPRGVDVILHNLTTGRDQLLGSVGDASFNKGGDLLAYTVDATTKDANGLFVLDLKSGRINTLDNDARVYNRLTWNDAGTALAVLKGLDVDKSRERENVLLAFSNVQAALGDSQEPPPVVLDPAKADGFPKGWVVSDRATLEWSDDTKRVFFGMKEQVPAPAANTRRNPDEVADVDVWNSIDERIQSVQMIRADADRNFTYREAFDVSAARFVKLADETMRELDVASDGKWAVGRDTRGYVSDYKRPAADIYRVNTTTGERTLMLKNQLTGAGTLGISPDGRYFLYWKDDRFQAYDLDAGSAKALGGATPPSFTDTEYDHPGPKPSYGIAGYSSDGKSVVVQQRYDLWALPLDGSAARSLTNGMGGRNEMRFRYVRTEPLDTPGGGPGGGGPGGGGRGGGAARQTIDLSKPITLSAYGEYTKKAGFYTLANGELKEVVYEDAYFTNPTRAAKADVFLFTRQTFAEFPDLRVSGPDFKSSRKITDANPQQAEYLWGHRILFDFKNKDGLRLQGILAIPDDYKPGEKRPMLVNFYEENSQNLNHYSAPSYLTGMGSSPIQAVSDGYITMLPDIHYRTGASHSDMLECVEAATRRVIEMGYVDPKRIGINGHSYGGEGAAFIGTRSRLFAAVGVGAGVTDLYYDFNQNWGWSYQVQGGSGANGNDYYLYGQGREAVSPWDNPEMYNFESALTHVREVTAPILIMHGTADPTVAFQNGLAFYNALRYNGKNAVLLAYPGEGHGLRGLANRKDLTIRYFQFFDHYLKDAPAPKWMTEGVPFLQKDIKKDPR